MVLEFAKESVSVLPDLVNTFGIIKAVSDSIIDMIVSTYHDKPLIFSWGNVSGEIRRPSSDNEKCGFFPINAKV